MTLPGRKRSAVLAQTAPRGEAVDIVAACRRLHAAIDRLDELAASTAGVSRSDLRCLNLLEFGPLPATAIARELNLATGSVTALVDRLESKGLVTRSREGADRRVVKVQATAKVFELIGPVYLGFSQRLQRVAATYPAAQQRLAVKHLVDVAQACELQVSEHV